MRSWEGGVPLGVGRALVPGAPARAGGRQPGADAVPARPRPDSAFEGVPAAEAQDAGLRGSGGGPLPDAADPHARGLLHLADGGAGARPERGPDRGDRASGTTSGIRPSGTSARRCWTRRCRSTACASGTTSTRCGWSTSWRATGAGSTSPSRCGTGSSTTPGRRSRRPWRDGWCGSSTGSRTSTTTSTMRCGPGSSGRAICRPPRSSCWGRPGRGGSTGWCRTWSSARGPRATSRRAMRSAGRCCGCGSSCSNGSTWGRRPGPSRRGRGWRCGRCSTTTWRTWTRCPPPIPDADPVQRVTDYIAGMTDRFCLNTYEALVARG